jgi:hypothetical protein
LVYGQDFGVLGTAFIGFNLVEASTDNLIGGQIYNYRSHRHLRLGCRLMSFS